VNEIEVCIVEPGQHRSAAGVDHDGLWPLKTSDLAIGADTQHLVSANGHRFGHRAATVGRIDACVANDKIDRTVVVVALRANDQAGNESGRDNCNDEVSGKAGRHGSSGNGTLPRQVARCRSSAAGLHSSALPWRRIAFCQAGRAASVVARRSFLAFIAYLLAGVRIRRP
jgi:hypothetical protein